MGTFLLISSTCLRQFGATSRRFGGIRSSASEHALHGKSVIRQYSLSTNRLHRNLAPISAHVLSQRYNWSDDLFADHRSPYGQRNLSLSAILREQASSKVEETVKNIQEKERKAKETSAAAAAAAAAAAPADTVAASAAAGSAAAAATATSTAVVKKPLKQRVWDELVHYYHGFRLLFIDINVARKLLMQVLRGNSLTRREYRLLVRTTGDVFRLVPFSVFIIVPFMEFLLPVFIKLFPGMLPSTFETAKERETKARSQLKVKLEMAKFLQKTLDEMDMQHKDHNSEEAKDFVTFFNKMRSSGGHATSEEIMRFSKLFEDEITLDSLSRQQLIAICKVLEVGTLGTSNVLRFQLRMKLRSLAADDQMIEREGVDSLTTAELQSASRSRGMRAYGLSEVQLRSQLHEWINLSLNEKVPPSLLLLSRAMMLPENVPTAEKLMATISSLPDAAAVQTRAAIGEREGKIDNKTQIEIIRDEQRKIKEDADELKEVERTVIDTEKDVLLDTAKVIADDITNKEIEVVCDALDAVSDSKNMIVEKEEIKELKEEIAEYKEDVEELQEIARKSDVKINVRESAAAKRLLKKVDTMIRKLDKVMQDLEKEKTLRVDEKAEGTVEPTEELVRIDEVMNAVAKMQKVTDQSKMQQISTFLERIDDDHDGHLKLDDVLKVFETIGKENVHLTGKQIDEIVDLISKEEYLENEDKIEKALAKSKEQREQQQQQQQQDTPQQTKSEAEQLTRSDDEKHILDAERTPTIDSKIDERLEKRITDLGISEQTKASSPSKKSSI